MFKLKILATIAQMTPSDEAKLEELYRRFGDARRRTYGLKTDSPRLDVKIC